MMRGSALFGRLSRMMVGEFALTFVVAFFFFLAVFFVNQLLYLAQDRLSSGVSLVDTLTLIWYALPAFVALSFPFASLLAVLMTTGKFSADNEVLAAQALGISIPRMAAPMLGAGLLVAVSAFAVNDYFLPLGTLRYNQFYQELLFANSELALRPDTVQTYGSTTIVTGESEGGEFRQVMLLDTTEDGKLRVITADRARIIRNARQDGVISLSMEGIQIHETDQRDKSDHVFVEADKMVYSILLKTLNAGVRNARPSEMGILDLSDLIAERQTVVDQRNFERARDLSIDGLQLSKDYYARVDDWVGGSQAGQQQVQQRLERLLRESTSPRADRTLQQYNFEFWKKVALPLSCLSFVFFGFPLALFARHDGRLVGLGLGVLTSVAYWGMLIGAEFISQTVPDIPVAPLVFFPNVLLLSLGAVFYYVRIHR